MKIAIQIINHNQIECIEPMIKALKNIKADRFWGLDRCTDGSKELLISLRETNIIENTEGEGFLAGKMRDLVIDQILKSDYEAVVMFDGDRYPSYITEESIQQELLNFDCVCFLGNIGGDFRYQDLNLQKNNKLYFLDCVTAGLVVRRKSIEIVRSLNIMKGRCFHEVFDGNWGCEDSIFGVALYITGATMGYSTVTKFFGNLGYRTIKEKLQEEKEQILIKSLILMYVPRDARDE